MESQRAGSVTFTETSAPYPSVNLHPPVFPFKVVSKLPKLREAGGYTCHISEGVERKGGGTGERKWQREINSLSVLPPNVLPPRWKEIISFD